MFTAVALKMADFNSSHEPFTSLVTGLICTVAHAKGPLIVYYYCSVPWILGIPFFVVTVSGASPLGSAVKLTILGSLTAYCNAAFTIFNMDNFDEMSDLSIPAEGQTFFPSRTARKTFHCKVFGCSKSYAHSSSLYRHVGSSHPMLGSFRNEQTLNFHQNNYAMNGRDRDEVGAVQNQRLSGRNLIFTGRSEYLILHNILMMLTEMLFCVDRNQVETRDVLRQQMTLAGQGALFEQFNVLLEMIPGADPTVIDYFHRFHGILHTALVRGVDGSASPMDIIVHEGEQLPYGHTSSSSNEDATTHDDITSSHMLGFSSDTTLAEGYSIDVYDDNAGGDYSLFPDTHIHGAK